MFFRSERLFLRPGWPEDWEDVLARIADEGVVRNLARVPWPYGAEDAKAFLSRPQDPLAPNFVVTLPTAQGNELIGMAGLSLDPESPAEVQLGYWIARPHWGQGYATEASRALLSQARAIGHTRIVAHHFADNPASGRVLRKVGFRPTGKRQTRYSQGRGGSAPSVGYEIELVAVSGDGNDRMKRAA